MPVPLEELTRFVAGEPPREMPPSVRAAKLPASSLVIAWTIALGVAVGTWPLIAAVFPERLVDDLRLDLGTTGIAVGSVVATEPTDRSIVRRDGETDVELSIHRIRFRFETADGRALDGTCFASDPVPAPEDTVRVEHLASAPEIARITDTTLSPTPRIGALIVLMPAIAGAWLLKVLAQRRRVRRLLVHGRFVLAEIVDIRTQTETLGPGRVVARLRAPGGDELEVDFDLARREGAVLRERAATTRRVGLLRDPARPTRFLLTDALLGPAGAATDANEEDDDEP